MVRKILLLSLVLAGCTDSAEPGGPCKADQTCADGLVCNFQAASPICLAADADEDGDGLDNKADLCPATAGGSNHDEDGDGQGDACDFCPIEAWKAGQRDADGDGLGGLCDPDDNEKGDKIVFFETFEKADALASWTLDDAAHFSISNDALQVTVTAADTGADAQLSLPVAPIFAAVFTSYRVVDPAPAGVDNTLRTVAVSLADPSPAAGSGRARCGASSDAGQEGQVRVTTDNGEANEPFAGSFMTGTPYRLLLQIDGGTARCVQIQGQTSAAAQWPVSSGQKPTLSMSTRSVAANYSYVMVVQSPAR